MSDKNRSKGVAFDKDGKPTTTIAYEQYRHYVDGFITPGGILQALEERRRFYRGDQYAKGYASNSPKPTLNLVHEGVTKIGAKITGTKRYIEFIADKDDESLAKLDDFYDYQTKKMKRDLTIADATMIALIDGTAVVFTAFDADTIGTEGLYKGFLKDRICPFETTFWSDPWTDDPQEMRYCGYFLDMEVGAAKELIEGEEEERAEKEKYIAKEDFFLGSAPYDFDKITDSDLTRVYVRFFRKNGEVYFELSTQYVDLTSHPHALNPKLAESRSAEMVKEFEKQRKEVEKAGTTLVADYETDPSSNTVFTDAKPETHGDYVKVKDKFSRYPVAVCIPYPELPHKCILGHSLSAMIIPNQKLYNYCYLLVTLIMQYHAMPKWVQKPNALGNQIIDNSPNQVLTDYTKIQDVGGNGFGITRLTSGEAINSNLIQIGDTLADNTRFMIGFANLEASGTSIDSGYEYGLRMKQINLPLEIPQMHVWDFCAELARNDLMYFKHYISNAKFYTVRSDASMAVNENYRNMEQQFINAGKSALPKGTVLGRSQRVEVGTISEGFFDAEFDVHIEVEQGIAGSELTESQHYNQIWTYVAQGNLTADKIKMLVQGDKAISRKTRATVMSALEDLETSQLAMKDQKIQALEQAVSELQNYMKFSQQVIQFQKNKQKATEQAAMEQNRVAAQLLRSKDQQAAAAGQQMSESEVKSLNAKGISGGSFSGGGNDTIYNTGA